MFDLRIEATRTAPYVLVDSANGIIEIRGKSSPESAIGFYFPLIDKVKKLFANHEGELNVTMALQYFNTSSSKCLFDLFRALKELDDKGVDVTIHWHYEEDDEDMMEAGEDFEDILGLEFNYVEEP